MPPRSADEIQVVLFDVGGVLVELGGVSTMLAWVNNSVSVEELWNIWLASPVVRQFETGRATPAEFADQIIRAMSLPVSQEEFLTAFAAWPRALYPGALEVVRDIPPKFQRATLSNTCVLHWQRVMKDMEMEHAFQHHFPSHLTGKIKPDEEAFIHVAETIGCAPSAILFLDDVALNVEAARSIGLHAVQAKGPAEARKVLLGAGIIRRDPSPAA
jgi:HAD superfamily hydrolase (TIGR01509 family)